jgi:hypothetical protein
MHKDVAPILMVGLVAVLALPLIAEHDPDVLFGAESAKGAAVPIKVAVAGAVLALFGGFFFGCAFGEEPNVGWLFLAYAFWAPAFHLLLRPKREPRPPEVEDVPWNALSRASRGATAVNSRSDTSDSDG